ncbi:LCP family protein [Patescibacteria group bacterium]|nr:LCP family protein [Patescibacteria group bacterium]
MKDYPELDPINDLPEFVPEEKTPKKAEKSSKKKPKKHFFVLKVFVGLLIFTAIFGSLFSYKVLSVSKDVFVGFEGKKASVFDQLKRLILPDNKELKGQAEGRTNILLIGMGGEGHSGAMLTDTIMVASIKYDKETDQKKIALISIPRDLYVPAEDNRNHKINSLFSIGERKGENQGAITLSKSVSQVTGLPIHYFVRVDFEGFRKVVDSLGGIDVEVERSFIDEQYPTYDFGYQTVSFDKGIQTMDGEKSLQFSRSRHGIVTDEDGGFEGSDFARAARQQRVLEAVKKKAFSVETAVNPKTINELVNVLGDHVRTSIEPWEVMIMLDIARNMESGSTINKVIDNGKSGLLYSSSRGGAYVLLPRVDDFSQIQDMSENVFEVGESEEDVSIFILNGSETDGLANEAASTLKTQEYKINGFGNALTKDYENTVIYTSGDKGKRIVDALQKKFQAKLDTSGQDFSKISRNTVPEDTNIVIVLGDSAQGKLQSLEIEEK